MKRFLYILSVFLVSLLLVGGMCIAVLQSERVEHAVLRLATAELSRGMGAKASIGNISYRFPARLQIDSIFLSDQQGDTLAYLNRVYAHFRPLPLLRNEIRFSRVDIEGGVANIYHLDSTRLNCTFLGEVFHSDAPHAEFRSFLSVRDIRIDSVRVRFDNYEGMLRHASLDLYHFTRDSLDAAVNHLSATLRKQDGTQVMPFVLSDMQARFVYQDTLVALQTLRIQLPESELKARGEVLINEHVSTFKFQDSGSKFQAGGDACAPGQAMVRPGDRTSLTAGGDACAPGQTLVQYGDCSSTNHSTLHFSLSIDNAELCPKDVAFFVPALAKMDKPVRMVSSLAGTNDSLSLRTLSLWYDKQPIFRGNAECLKKSETWKDAYVRLECEDLSIFPATIQDLVADLTNKPFHLPKEVHRLGNIHYRGQIAGVLHDLSLHGAFRTSLGVITTDASLQADSAFQNLHYNARVATHKFRLGKMLAHAPLGPVSLDVRASGDIQHGVASGKVRGKIRDITYNNYTYQALAVDGTFRPNRFDGTVSINDENLRMQFAGLVNLSEQAPDINFDLRLHRFRPEILGLSEALRDTEVGLSLSANLSGITPDKMNGYLVVDSLHLRREMDSVMLQQIKLTVLAEENDQKHIRLTSDIMTGSLSGAFRYAELPYAFLRLAYQYLPDAFPAATANRLLVHESAQPQTLDFYLYGHRLKPLQRVLRLPFTLGDQPVLKGFYHEADGLFGVQAYATSVRVSGTPIEDITLAFNNFDGPAALSLSAKAKNMNATTHIAALDNHVNIDVGLHQLDSMEHVYAGDLHLHTHFSQYAGKPLIDLHLLPSMVVLKDSTYTINESHINYCVADTTLSIENFQVEASHQYIRANGVASKRSDDSLRVELGNIDAGFILPFVLPEKEFKLGGYATGWATLYNLFNQPVFEADVRLDSTRMNDMPLGTTYAQVALDKETKNILINGDVYTPTKRLVAHVDGEVITASGHWGITVYPDSIPLSFINHWTEGIIADISGYGSGVVDVFGENHKVWVTAKVKAEDGALTIPFTGCRYYLNDSVTMDSTSIQFRNIMLHDEEQHTLLLDGALYHDCFKNFRYGFDVQVNDGLALNLPDKAGEMLQGRVYANGKVRIEGNEAEVNIQADARTVGKSRFRFSIDYASTASESNFIQFVDHNTVSIYSIGEEEEEPDLPLTWTKPSNTRILLAMNIEVDQHLLAQLVLGERNGDILQGRGSGSLRFTYDSQNEDIKLMGNYVLQQGTLDFTVGNVIRRQFVISEGSSVSWSGNVEQPQLDVTAKYKVTASLKDLFGSEISQLATTRTSVPVNTCLTLRGTLDNPILQFGIELPNSDENIQSQVKAIINTDEMLMRQVVYLLVFGKFFMPEYMTSTQYIGVNESYSLLSSTITGQINAWLSKLTNVFTMGVNIRTDGEGADASQEYEAQFQLQPVERLLINGNVGYRYNDIANQPFFGDLDVEVMLTEDGRLRLKGYTHTVDKYSLRQASTIQGIGFLWKQDFNTPTKEEREQRKAARKEKKDRSTR